MAAMTSRERVLCSLDWNDPDRVPIQLYTTPEVDELLFDHFGGHDVRQCLGVDFRDFNAEYRGQMQLPHDNIVMYDWWGTGYIQVDNGRGGYYDEAFILPFASMETMDDVEAHPWPSPDDFDYSQLVDQCKTHADYALCCGHAGFPDILNGVSRSRGMEQVVIDIATRDEVGLAIIDRRCDILHEVLRRTLEAGEGRFDIVCLGEDMGNQNGRMFSPKDFEEVFRPRLQRFIDLAHQYDCRAMMHSCGDTHEIQPTLIEMGLDILDAMQPEPAGMDPEAMRKACCGRLAFCGLISTQSTLPFKDEAACRAEARHRLDVIAPGGGYIFSPSHQIQAGTPLRNILAVYEEALGRKLM